MSGIFQPMNFFILLFVLVALSNFWLVWVCCGDKRKAKRESKGKGTEPRRDGLPSDNT